MANRRPNLDRTSKGEVSRLKILDAAAPLFRQKGYTPSTLNEIGEAAEMRAGSLYYHFNSKGANP